MLFLLLPLLRLQVAGASCTLCPGGRLQSTEVTFFDEDMPTHKCSDIQAWLNDEKCDAGRSKWNATCCDFSGGGLKTFYISEYSLGPFSVTGGWSFQLLPYLAAYALHEGFFASLIPNWKDFRIEILSFGTPMVVTTGEGSDWVNQVLPHIMHQSEPNNGNQPNQISFAMGGRWCGQATLKIASALGIFGVPIAANVAEMALEEKQMYPTFLRVGATDLTLAYGVAPFLISLKLFRLTIILEFGFRAITDLFRERFSSLSPETATMQYNLPHGGRGEGNVDDAVAAITSNWDKVVHWVETVVRTDPRAFYAPTNSIWIVCYFVVFIEMGFFDHYLTTKSKFTWFRGDVQSNQLTVGEFGGLFLNIMYEEMFPDSEVWSYDFRNMHDYMYGTMAGTVFMLSSNVDNDDIGLQWKKLIGAVSLESLYSMGALQFAPGRINPDAATGNMKSEEAFWLAMLPGSWFLQFYAGDMDSLSLALIAIGKLVAEGKTGVEVRGQALLENLQASDFPGMSGRIKFDASGQLLYPTFFYQAMTFNDGSPRTFPAEMLMTSAPLNFFEIAYYDAVNSKILVAAEATAVSRIKVYDMCFADNTSIVPPDQRLPCEAGYEYTDYKNGCMACSPGRYSPIVGSQCINCMGGFASDKGGRFECDMCPEGSDTIDVTMLCKVCVGGQSKEQGVCAVCEGQQECDPCAFAAEDTLVVPIPLDGNTTWEMRTGSWTCSECPVGRSAPSRGTPECGLCTAGTFTGEEGSVACNGCARAAYAEGLGSTVCTKCPETMTTIESAADALTDCVCLEGTYHVCEGQDECQIGFKAPEPGFCTACPVGSTCKGPTDNPTAMFLSDRHRPPWVPANSMAVGTDVYLCSVKVDAVTKCKGGFMGIDEMCTEGTHGLACAECPMGYYYDGLQCTMCQGTPGTWIALSIALLLALALYLTKVSMPNEPNGTFTIKSIHTKRILAALNVIIGLGFSLVQFAWLFTRMSSVSYDPGLYSLLAESGNALFDADFINTPCTFSFSSTPMSAVAHTAILNILPLFVVLISGCLVAVGSLPQANGKKRWPNKHDAINNLLVIFSTFFMIIANSAINTGFASFEQPTGESSLVAYPSILTTSSEAQTIRAICIVGILLWCAGGLAIVIWATWQLPKRQDDPVFRRCTLALQLKYNPSAPWWFVVLLFQKLLIAVSITLFSTSNWQGVFICAVYIIYLALFICFRPTFAPICFYCEIFSTIGIVTLFLTIWGLEAEDGGSYMQILFAIITYSQLVMFLVLALVVTIRKEVFNTHQNVAELLKDVGGRVNKKTGFGEMDTMEKYYGEEQQQAAEPNGNKQGESWNNATV